jgi:hypothetical protein
MIRSTGSSGPHRDPELAQRRQPDPLVGDGEVARDQLAEERLVYTLLDT